MKRTPRAWKTVLLCLAVTACFLGTFLHGLPRQSKEAPMVRHATGTFDVNLTPHATGGAPESSGIGQMTLSKQFHGQMEGHSDGEMLTCMTAIKGSAGYVALEKFTGTLGGRKGSFALQHTGSMARGAQSLSITVVPDSGTEELEGISGTFHLRIEEGKHFYDLEYTLPQ